ncbi:MAG: 50S ribosomal protein L29 [Candidatus Latescibacterota bacterium]
MKPYEIRAMSVEEVRRQLSDSVEGLSNLRFQQATNQLSDALRVRYARRNVARLKAILHEHDSGIRKLTADGVKKQEDPTDENG